MALKDKLMTLEDFKAVRDVDVASNSAQFTEIKADLGALSDLETSVKTDVVSAINEAAKSGISDDAKEALLNCLKHLTWVNVSTAPMYIDALRKALYGWDEDTIYKLIGVPVSIDGSTTLATDFTLWESEYSFSLFIEYIDNTNHSVDTENKMLFRQIRSSPWGAFYMQTYNGGAIDNSNYNARTTIDLVSGSGDSIRRVWDHPESKSEVSSSPRRLVVTYNSSTHSLTIDFSVNGQVVNPYSTKGDLSSFNFYEMDSANPMVIGSLDNTSRFFNGVINDFRIIKKVATSGEINAYLTGGTNT